MQQSNCSMKSEGEEITNNSLEITRVGGEQQQMEMMMVHGGEVADEADHSMDSYPPGYRFEPTDQELVVHYLQKKVLGQPLPKNKIIEVNLYQYDPDTIAAKYMHYGGGEWYFFTSRDRKYPNGDRPNRTAGNGYWKATGADKAIIYKGTKLGLKKALVYYAGKPPKGQKSSWIMHEYTLVSDRSTRPDKPDKPQSMRLDDYVLCRIYKKSDKARIRPNRYIDNVPTTPLVTSSPPTPETDKEKMDTMKMTTTTTNSESQSNIELQPWEHENNMLTNNLDHLHLHVPFSYHHQQMSMMDVGDNYSGYGDYSYLYHPGSNSTSSIQGGGLGMTVDLANPMTDGYYSNHHHGFVGHQSKNDHEDWNNIAFVGNVQVPLPDHDFNFAATPNSFVDSL